MSQLDSIWKWDDGEPGHCHNYWIDFAVLSDDCSRFAAVADDL